MDQSGHSACRSMAGFEACEDGLSSFEVGHICLSAHSFSDNFLYWQLRRHTAVITTCAFSARLAISSWSDNDPTIACTPNSDLNVFAFSDERTREVISSEVLSG